MGCCGKDAKGAWCPHKTVSQSSSAARLWLGDKGGQRAQMRDLHDVHWDRAPDAGMGIVGQRRRKLDHAADIHAQARRQVPQRPVDARQPADQHRATGSVDPVRRLGLRCGSGKSRGTGQAGSRDCTCSARMLQRARRRIVHGI